MLPTNHGIINVTEVFIVICTVKSILKIFSVVRLLMRREQVLKICLNHYISSDLELMPKDEKTWMWHAQDFSEGVLAPEKFACRFKTAEIAADFAAAVEEAKVGITFWIQSYAWVNCSVEVHVLIFCFVFSF